MEQLRHYLRLPIVSNIPVVMKHTPAPAVSPITQGWEQTQQRIAKAKGVDQATISRRLKFNSMSDKVKDFMRKGLVDEFHLAGIITLCAAHNLSLWLTTSQVWEELAVTARAKNVTKGTVSERLRFNTVSDKMKQFIARGLLDEFHLREIIRLSPGDNLSPWLTTGQAWEELAEKARITPAEKHPMAPIYSFLLILTSFCNSYMM